jgi:hypothetical protein
MTFGVSIFVVLIAFVLDAWEDYPLSASQVPSRMLQREAEEVHTVFFIH